MAKNQNTIKKKAIGLIQDPANNLMFHSEVHGMLPISEATYYGWKMNEDPEILEALEINRVITKRGLRARMFNSENPTAWAMLYKLIGNEDELRRLTNGEGASQIPAKIQLEVVGLSGKEAKQLEEGISAITNGHVIEIDDNGKVI